MTREEAITNLNIISVAFVVPVTKEQRKLIDDTFDMAIQALSQEPCDDAVSRDAVIDAIERVRNNHAYDEIEEIQKLPSVTQSGKWINKDDFIYALKTCGFSVHHGQVMYAEDDLIQRFDEMAESEE